MCRNQIPYMPYASDALIGYDHGRDPMSHIRYGGPHWMTARNQIPCVRVAAHQMREYDWEHATSYQIRASVRVLTCIWESDSTRSHCAVEAHIRDALIERSDRPLILRYEGHLLRASDALQAKVKAARRLWEGAGLRSRRGASQTRPLVLRESIPG